MPLFDMTYKRLPVAQKDTNKEYWWQKNDNPRFKGISKNQSYYTNKQGELVICFD